MSAILNQPSLRSLERKLCQTLQAAVSVVDNLRQAALPQLGQLLANPLLAARARDTLSPLSYSDALTHRPTPFVFAPVQAFWACPHHEGRRHAQAVLQVLLNAGIPTSVFNQEGCSPVLWLTQDRDVDLAMAQQLLLSGADPNLGTRAGVSPLHRAIDAAPQHPNAHLLNVLLQAGANPLQPYIGSSDTPCSHAQDVPWLALVLRPHVERWQRQEEMQTLQALLDSSALLKPCARQRL